MLREILTDAVTKLSVEVEGLCGAGYGERSPERVNTRNGYRSRPWDTRLGTIDLAIPKLRHNLTRATATGNGHADVAVGRGKLVDSIVNGDNG